MNLLARENLRGLVALRVQDDPLTYTQCAAKPLAFGAISDNKIPFDRLTPKP